MPRKRYSRSRAERKQHRSRLFHVSFKLILLVFASLLATSYLSVFISPETISLASFFGLYFIPIACLNLILLTVAVLRRSTSFWIPFLALVPSLFLGEFFYQPQREAQPHRDGEIKIMTYNVGLFSLGSAEMTRDDRREAVMKFIRSESPDIVCLQEYSVRDTASIRRYFKEYRYVCHSMFVHRHGAWTGNLTLSKLPIRESGVVTFPESRNLSLWCDIEHNGRLYRLFNNHLESNSISLTSLLNKFGERSDGFTSELEKAHGKMRVSVSRRSRQTNGILKNISECRKPSIVCGDFNDTPVSYTFHRLCSGRKDTFCEAGHGAGATYSMLWPLLRIDFTLIPESSSALDHRTEKIPYSDHYPVITRILLENEENL